MGTLAEDSRRRPNVLPPNTSVGVVLVTHNRPQLMLRALESILAQDSAETIEVVVVFDRAAPDHSLETQTPGRRVRVLSNDRTPGLAGARNTGVLALGTDFVAFCDDDDMWLPGKLDAQLRRLAACPEAHFATTAMRVDIGDRGEVRLAGRSIVSVSDMARSRMAMLHSSSFLFRRASMVEGFGLVDETIPQSMAEDWDLLLRASRQSPIQHVDEPLVRVLWGGTSYFNQAWHDKNAAHVWLLEHHPEFASDRVGSALLYGKLAFGHATTGQRRTALRFVVKCVSRRWREPRGWLALLVLAGVPGGWIQGRLNRRGHGV